MRSFQSVLLQLVLLGAFSLSLAAEPNRTTLGLTSRVGSSSLPFVIAEEKGFFKREGLNTVVVVMQNQVVVQGVLSRNVDYGGTFSNFVGAALRGLPLRIVMAAMDGSDHVLVTSKNIKKVEDLKGKIIGASRPGTSTDYVLDRLLPRVGLIPGKDVKLLPTGLLVSEERLALLLQKRVDATLANQESVSQFQHKGHPLTILADALSYGVNSSVDFST